MVLSSSPSQHKPQRLLLGGIAIVLGIVAVLARLEIGFAGNTAGWICGSFGKAAIVSGVAWLAWPQLMWLQRSPGGGIAVAALGVLGVAFIARPRLLLYAVPLVVAAAGLLMSLTWIQRFLSPPK